MNDPSFKDGKPDLIAADKRGGSQVKPKIRKGLASVGDILVQAKKEGSLIGNAVPLAKELLPSSVRTPSDTVQGKHHYTKTGQVLRLVELPEAPRDIGFFTRMMTLATMPHSNPGDAEIYERVNGDFKLVMQRGHDSKLPYGSYPRLILAWICSEAVEKQTRSLTLGESLSDFMRQLGLAPTGGRWGTIPQLKEQLRRLLNTRISVSFTNRDKRAFFNIARNYDLWWDSQQPAQSALWNSTLTLSEDFYFELINHPIPINLRILRELKRSPLGLDLYLFLTYRVSYLKKPTEISWKSLHEQFGAEYADMKNFKRKARREIQKIKLAWPQLYCDDTKPGRLCIFPSRPSIPPTTLIGR